MRYRVHGPGSLRDSMRQAPSTIAPLAPPYGLHPMQRSYRPHQLDKMFDFFRPAKLILEAELGHVLSNAGARIGRL